MISNIILYFICKYKTLNFTIWKLKVVISGYQNAPNFFIWIFFSSVDWYYTFILKLGNITLMIKYSYFQISKVYSFYFIFYANSYNVLWKARLPSKWRKNRIKNIVFFKPPPQKKTYQNTGIRWFFFTVFNFYASKTSIRKCKCTVLYRNAQKRAKEIKAGRLTEISVGLGIT